MVGDNMAKKSSNTKTKNVKKINEKAIDNKCPGCGAPIHFNPSLNKWKCEYCSSEFSLEEMQKHNNASSIQNNDNVEENIEHVNEDVKYISYKCKNCGAEIIADEQTAATFCVYCGNVAILKKIKTEQVSRIVESKGAAISAGSTLSFSASIGRTQPIHFARRTVPIRLKPDTRASFEIEILRISSLVIGAFPRSKTLSGSPWVIICSFAFGFSITTTQRPSFSKEHNSSGVPIVMDSSE